MYIQTRFFIALLFGAFSAPALAQLSNYEKGLQSYEANKVEEAYIHLKNALQDNPDYLPAQILLAKILIDRRQYAMAENELDRAARKGADGDIIVELLGQALLAQAKYEQALNYANRMVLSDAGEVHYQLVQAQAHRALGNIGQAESIYRAIVLQQPLQLKANLGLAAVLLSQQQLDEAEQLLATIKSVASSDSQYWLLAGRAHYLRDDVQLALAAYQKAVELAPESVPALKALAITYYVDLANYDKAQQSVEQILAIAPNDPHAQLIKSNLLADLNQDSVADQVLMQLHSQLSRVDTQYLLKSSELLLIDSVTSYKLQKWEEASRKFETYLDKERDVNAAVMLADTYLQLELYPSALALLDGYKKELLDNLDQALILASLYVDYGKLYDSRHYLPQIEQRYPGAPSLLVLMAKSLTKRGQYDEALATLLRATDQSDRAYQYALATAYGNVGQPQQALAIVNELLQQEPNNQDHLLFKARLLVQLQQADEAEKIVAGLYQRTPDERNVAYAYASLLRAKGQPQQALSVIKPVTQAHSRDNQLWYLLAKIETDLGRVDEAVDILKEKVKGDRLTVTVELAKIYHQEGRFDDAMSMVDSALYQDPNNEEAAVLKAQMLIEQRDRKGADRVLAKLSRLWAENAARLVELSRMQRANQALTSAEQSLRQALALQPSSSIAFIELIELSLQQQKVSEAKSLLADFADLEGASAVYLEVLRGDVALAENKTEQALTHYQAAFKLDPLNVKSFTRMTQLSASAERQQQYAQLVEAQLDKQPHNDFMRHTLADFYLQHGQFDRAQHHLQLLLTQPVPDFRKAVALNNLAFIHIQKNNYPLAVSTSAQALQLLPQNAQFLDTHGWALTLNEQYSEGLGYLREAHVRESSEIEIRFHLAYALAKTGRQAEARALLQQLPDFPKGIAEQKFANELFSEIFVNSQK
ncbi:PEP-CTERM system TPR-repeat protein PrsT [Neiella sp. HB171785]|uniref:PEP-CTERM system TPR-repeat protein PrsT n=1 Tax=Neiella litorisoli TaxID=2771431 RepID=A0A8J6UGW5_9GAMM|nr:XrtA/PEP-CTERM system TPR-repeat protein PrsT [Neiella litorisoli]MBD1390871.1 PEP-CTERM system TPR-repeat protein PrsT [Neiella litorisoli]